VAAPGAPHLDLVNAALVHDEVLLDVSRVLDGDWPVGPSFLHSLGTLAEALVIHNQVFFGPRWSTDEEDSGRNTIAVQLQQSNFVRELSREGGLTLAPAEQIDAVLVSKCTGYRLANFVMDASWVGLSFASATPEGEANDYRNLVDLVKGAPAALATKDLITMSRPGVLAGDASVFLATVLGFNEDDLRIIEGLNHRAAAYVDLTRHLGIDLYPVYSALPHQLGAVGAHHLEVRRIYDTVENYVVRDDQTTVGESGFSRVPIPPIAQIAMARCKGDPAALGQELLALRERHQKFRRYLTEFDRQWNEAETRRDRSRLARDFTGSWDTLLAKENRPHASRARRIIGFIWDIVKSATLVGAMAAGGDKVMTTWQEQSIIRRVSGLHDFYQELARSPLPEHNRQLVASLFPRIVEDPVWDAAAKLAEATEAAFIAQDPLQAVQQPLSSA
jgi:hypothetical protein